VYCSTNDKNTNNNGAVLDYVGHFMNNVVVWCERSAASLARVVWREWVVEGVSPLDQTDLVAVNWTLTNSVDGGVLLTLLNKE
jgi:hypothetical protein